MEKFKNLLINGPKYPVYSTILGGFLGGLYGGINSNNFSEIDYYYPSDYYTAEEIQKAKNNHRKLSISLFTCLGMVGGLVPLVPITGIGLISLIKLNEIIVNKITPIENIHNNHNKK